VHARGQCFHFDLPVQIPDYLMLSNMNEEKVSCTLQKILGGLHENDGLSPSIQVIKVAISVVAVRVLVTVVLIVVIW
jgi:hypothetical protein